jgi:hypothetical protein
MVQKVFLSLLLYLSVTYAQYSACDVSRTLTAVGQSVNINHLTSHGNCRYSIISPFETYLEASCKIATVCNRHIFALSRAGELDLSDGTTYCGSGSPPIVRSIGNELVIALNNGGFAPGSFSCTVRVVNNNCDCGWSANTKIVGGINTGVNEFVSHAALVDTGTRERYCGAIIGEKLKFCMNLILTFYF